MQDPSDPRRDIEKFIAAGGGTFARLLDMLRDEQPVEAPPQTPGSPAWLPQGYLLEYGPDALTLHRAGGSFVAAFSVGGYTREAIRRTAEEDRKGWPSYCGPDGYAYSVRRMVETRAARPWERFLRTERRVLEARRRGQMARALTWRLPGEAREVLDRIASEDRRRAEEGLVELRSEEGEFYFKPVEELSPQDRMDRLRAELVRIEWLLERHERYAVISRSGYFGKHQSRKSFGV